jgi:cytochrome bd-type quinol oxidase subunit 2
VVTGLMVRWVGNMAGRPPLLAELVALAAALFVLFGLFTIGIEVERRKQGGYESAMHERGHRQLKWITACLGAVFLILGLQFAQLGDGLAGYDALRWSLMWLAVRNMFLLLSLLWLLVAARSRRLSRESKVALVTTAALMSVGALVLPFLL